MHSPESRLQVRSRQAVIIRTCRALVACAGMALGLSASAQSPVETFSIKELEHTSWTFREGAPRNISAFVEGGDGRLWIGSDVTLFTFDGLHFTRFVPKEGSPQLPLSPIETLYASRDGSLWVGFDSGEVAHLVAGQVKIFSKSDGLPGGIVSQITEDRFGKIWGVAGRQLVGLRHGHWESGDPQQQFREDGVTYIFFDRANTLWAAGSTWLWFRPASGHAFEKTTEAVQTVESILEDPKGRLWMMYVEPATDLISVRRVNVPGHYTEKPLGMMLMSPSFMTRMVGLQKAHGQGIQFDPLNSLAYHARAAGHRDMMLTPDGQVWSSDDEGLTRLDLESGLPTGSYSKSDGLSSAPAQRMLVDRSGDVWVATDQGIDRFVQPKMHTVMEAAVSSNTSLSRGGHGQVWFGGSPEGRLTVYQGGLFRALGSNEAFFIFTSIPPECRGFPTSKDSGAIAMARSRRSLFPRQFGRTNSVN